MLVASVNTFQNWHINMYCGYKCDVNEISLLLLPSGLHLYHTQLRVLQVTSDCAPSMFAYPPPVTTETKDTGAKMPTAVLSTTAKAKDKAKKKEAEKAVKEGRTTADDLKEGTDKPEGALLLLPF